MASSLFRLVCTAQCHTLSRGLFLVFPALSHPSQHSVTHEHLVYDGVEILLGFLLHGGIPCRELHYSSIQVNGAML